MSNLNSILTQIIQLQAKTVDKIKQTAIVKEVQDNNYTAWEVMPHTENIPLNGLSIKIDGNPDGNPDGETIYNTQYVPRIPGDEYSNQANFGVIISSTIEEFRIRTTKPADKSDVIINWGDGITDELSKIGTLVGTYEIDNKYIEYTYSVTHDYSLVTEKDSDDNWKKFIIKIYGRDYFGLTRYSSGNNDQGQQNKNLMCRVFDSDLPIASHLTHLAYFCHGAYRLLYVNIPPLCKLTYFANLAGLFNFCVNLRYAYGFKRMYSPYTIEEMFKHCTALTKTDFRFPNTITSAKKIFYNCKSLKADISKMFDGNGFANQKVDLSNAFYMDFTSAANTFVYPIGEDGKTTVQYDSQYASSENHGMVNAINNPSGLSLELSMSIDQLLWNNQTVDINGTEFIKGCDNTLLSTFPVSWGGTNNRIDTELAITDEMKLDYTAFEVLAHNYDISAGMINEDTRYTYGYQEGVPSCMTHKMILRSTVSQDKQDIIIDWGDGTELDFLVDSKSASMKGTDYYVSHTYETSGKYIVKIYGKQYYAIKYHGRTTDDENYNLICRVFDYDLPVASHIVNFSSFCYNAKRLQKVEIPRYSEFVSRAINFGDTFHFCRNLVSVKGFDTYTNPALYACNSMFGDCNILETCDFKIPSYMIANNIDYLFGNAYKLSGDINNILPAQGFNVDKMSVTNMFNTCTSLTGTVPADILWNDKTVKWSNTSNAFLNSSDEIRAQVPVSWGGTNSNIDAELAITDEMKLDYTAFEVMPNSVQIKATTPTTLDTTYFGTTENPEIIKRAIAANTTHIMFIRSKHAPSEQDVIIDWGDSNFTKLSDGINSNDCYYVTDTEDPSEYVYYLKHDYADSLTNANLTFNRYIVKIYGKNYIGIKYTNAKFIDKNGETVTITSPTTAIYNLISRVFESDLPIASHIINLSSFCYAATRLIRVNVQINQQFDNLGNIFQSCGNLLSATGLLYRLIKNTSILSNMFASCKFLETVDLKIPAATTSIDGLFNACENLSVDIISLLPSAKFNSLSINVSNAFGMCRKLKCSDTEMLGQYFWNNHNVSWTNISTAFVEPYIDTAINQIIEYIPASWGGTASDNIIKKDYLYIDTPKADELYIPSGTTINEQALTIEINFDYVDDFTGESCQTYVITDCQVFSPEYGNWIQIEDSLTTEFTNTKIRLVKPTISFNNCRYKWIFTYTDDTGSTTNTGTWQVVNI